ncbi:MAG: glycosyltransferase family 2 protein [Sedimentisphaerales bacterium]|nr:glycosyltransferase family 2 protein [Sedimentisphaerales bacterium]
MSGSSDKEISIVIPVFNEQESLGLLHEEIVNAIGNRYTHEIIYVDDGSSDNSYSILKALHAENPNVCVIRFRKNFGQTAALAAGFRLAQGRVIVPLDADLQNDPADIPMLVEKLAEGFDIVSGWRKDRQDTFLTRTLPSRLGNWLIGRITGVRLHDYGCTLKAYRAESLKEIRLYGEMHRFIPALASWGGEKVAEMVVNHRPRTTGTTKYGLNRTFKVLLDLITIKFLASFSTKPIYVFGGLGGMCFLGSVVSGVLVLYYRFMVTPFLSMNRNPLLVLSMMLMTAAIQFVMMGLLAEIMVRTYHESQDRAIYVIETILESVAEPKTAANLTDESKGME